MSGYKICSPATLFFLHIFSLLALILIESSQSPAIAECKVLPNAQDHLWSAFDTGSLNECKSQTGVFEKGWFPSNAFGRELVSGIKANLVVRKSTIDISGVLLLNQLATDSFDLKSLRQYCKEFDTTYVAGTFCGLWLPDGAHLNYVVWPKSQIQIAHVPVGLEFDDVNLEGEDSIIWLSGAMLDGSLHFQRIKGSKGPIRIELKNCVVVGDVEIENVDNLSLWVENCVIFGNISITGGANLSLGMSSVAIEGNVAVSNIIEADVSIMRTHVLESFRLDSVVVKGMFATNLLVGGNLALSKVDLTSLGDEGAIRYLENIRAKGGSTISGSRLPPNFGTFSENFSNAQSSGNVIINR